MTNHSFVSALKKYVVSAVKLYDLFFLFFCKNSEKCRKIPKKHPYKTHIFQHFVIFIKKYAVYPLPGHFLCAHDKGMSTILDIIPAIGALLDRIIPDPVAREKAKLELLRTDRAQDLEELKSALAADVSQSDINKIEAASGDRFVAGWRPFIGWVCGVAFAYHFVAQPLLAFIIANTTAHVVVLPVFEMDTLSTVLMGMLGLGGLRTLEKIRSITK